MARRSTGPAPALRPGTTSSADCCVVVSDGSPMDSATHLTNDPGYLDRHLDATLARVESDGVVDVVGLGVGVDLSRHYRHGHVLDFDGPVDQSMLREVVDLLAASSHRRRPW